MSSHLSVRVSREGDEVVIHVEGEVDMAAMEQLRDSVEPFLAPNQTILMDLSGITFADSTLIKVLVKARGELTAAGGTLLLRNPSEKARRLLTYGELDTLIQDEAERQNDDR
jgi:anti-anti-sigma factor